MFSHGGFSRGTPYFLLVCPLEEAIGSRKTGWRAHTGETDNLKCVIKGGVKDEGG